eukprot:gene15730-17315_t
MKFYILASLVLLVVIAVTRDADAFEFGGFNFNSLKKQIGKAKSGPNKFANWGRSFKNKFLSKGFGGKFSQLFGNFFGKKQSLGNFFGKKQPLGNFFGKKQPETKSPESKSPDFCGNYECPPFTVKNKTNIYELRCYEKANWVSTSGFGYPTPMGSTTVAMFRKLLGYIEGANKQQATIDMTVPVICGVKGKGDKRNMRMSFYIPKKYQSNPPMPTDPAVQVTSSQFCAYVHSYSGYVTSLSTVEEHLDMLKRQLKADGLEGTYNTHAFITAGYNKPTEFVNRHNEVWLIKL